MNKITRILTPMKSKNPIYSFRNIRALFSAIFNKHEAWMEIQDSFEFGNRTNSYNRKVWKYKMMIRKLNSEVPDALEQASKGEFDLLENITRDQLDKLSETERELYILRRNKLGEQYKGKSLCISPECVKKLHKIFESVNKSFFGYVQE